MCWVMHMFSKPWSELVGHRWDWAATATAEFRASIDASSHSYFDDREKEFTAVLFGPTYVGKTTLLLHLMGVRPESQDHVAQVLRANRKLATSSTATPTRYRWSGSEKWSLRIGDSEPLSLDEEAMHSHLEKFRDGSGAPTAAHVVHEVGIPSLYRSQSTGPSPVVVDLPGIWAENAAERELASALARRFVPTAHVVIIVLRVNQLTLLDKDRFLPSLQLRQWVHAPERFRIVLTRVFSDAEMERHLTSLGRDPGPDDVRQILMAEGLNTLQSVRRATQRNAHLHARISAALFPVEYGDSWNDLALTRPDYQCQVEGIRSHYLTQLADSLRGVTIRDARYTSLVRASETIRLAAEDHHQSLALRIAAAEVDLDSAVRHAGRVQQGVDAARRHRNWSEEIERELELAGASPPRIPSSLRQDSPEHHSGGATGVQVRAELDELAERFALAGSRAWAEWANSREMRLVRRELRAPVPIFENKADRILRAAVNCCGDCSSQFWALFSGDPSKCRGRQAEGAAKAYEDVNGALGMEAHSQLASLRRNRKLRVRRRKGRQLEAMERFLAGAQSEVAATKANLHHLQQLENERAAIEASDLEQAQALDGLLRREVLTQLRTLDGRLGSTDAPDRTATALLMFLVLKSWHQLKHEAGAA